MVSFIPGYSLQLLREEHWGGKLLSFFFSFDCALEFDADITSKQPSTRYQILSLCLLPTVGAKNDSSCPKYLVYSGTILLSQFLPFMHYSNCSFENVRSKGSTPLTVEMTREVSTHVGLKATQNEDIDKTVVEAWSTLLNDDG